MKLKSSKTKKLLEPTKESKLKELKLCEEKEALETVDVSDKQELSLEEKVQVQITTVHPTHAVGQVKGTSFTALLHACQLSVEPNHMTPALHSIKPFETLTCYVIKLLSKDHKSPCKLYEVSQRLKSKRINQQFSAETFSVGTRVMAYVYAFFGKAYSVEVTSQLKGRIDEYLIADKPVDNSEDFVGKAVECIVIKPTNPLQLRVKGTVIDGVTGDDEPAIKKGCIATGIIKSVGVNTLTVKTLKGAATAHVTDLFDGFVDSPLSRFKVGQVVKCYVLKCPLNAAIQISLKASHTCVTDTLDVNNVPTIGTVKQGDLMQGYVKRADEYGVFITLSRHLDTRVGLRCVPNDILASNDIGSVLYPGRVVTCTIMYIGDNKVNSSLLRKHMGESIDSSRKRSAAAISGPANKFAKITIRSREEIIDMIKHTSAPSTIEIRCVPGLPDDDIVDPGWDDATRASGEKPKTSDYESDTEELPRKTKQLSKKERIELAEAEESALRRRELELMDDSKSPQTNAEWERILTSQPDNSMLWIRYMAHHIHATEIGQAREVAEKALRTINFRKENEKLNVWVSLLNLENMYGTDVTMEQTLRRAMQENDQRKVLKHLANIYTQSGKLDKAKETHELTIKKFRGEKDAWLAYIRYLMVDQKKRDVQSVLERCLKSVDKQQHMEVISKVAQLEFKHGDVEKGRSIFENLVTSFPKRTDVWSIYIDMLVQLERYDEARELFNRVTSNNLSTKKISSFFKRFVEFEVNHGNESTINNAKNKALTYLNDSAK